MNNSNSIVNKVANFNLYDSINKVMKEDRDMKLKNNFKERAREISDFFAKIGNSVAVEFITTVLNTALIPIELAVKTAIVTGLDQIFGCTLKDFHIPNELRRTYYEKIPGQTQRRIAHGKGVSFNVREIDLSNKMVKNPFYCKEYYESGKWLMHLKSKNDSLAYFGVDQDKGVYSLARAEDFDAFLWFVMNKCETEYTPTVIDKDKDNYEFVKNQLNAETTGYDFQSMLSKNNFQSYSLNPSVGIKMEEGSTFSYKRGGVISVCDGITEQNNNGIRLVKTSHLIPLSDTVYGGANWYANSSYFSGIYKGITEKNRGEYEYNSENEFPIMHVNFIGNSPSSYNRVLSPNGMFNFFIMPNPSFHSKASVDDGSFNPHAMFRKKLTFNELGEPEENGKYSVYLGNITLTSDSRTEYQITDSNGAVFSDYKLVVREQTTGFKYEISGNSNDVSKKSCLYECYDCDTMFKFNHDFIMGMRLFDVKEILWGTISNLIGATQITFTFGDSEEKIKAILSNIFTKTMNVNTDCYMTFSNDQYNMLLEDAARKRHLQNGNDNAVGNYVEELLEAISDYDNMTAEQQHDVIEYSFSCIENNIVNSENEGSVKDDIKTSSDFFSKLLESLYQSFVMSLLTPKLMTIVNINRKIVGEYTMDIDWEKAIVSMASVVLSICKQIIEYLFKLATDFIIKKVEEMSLHYLAIVVREQAEMYYSTLTMLINRCGGNISGLLGLIPNRKITSTLDSVSGADINIENNESAPKDEC